MIKKGLYLVPLGLVALVAISIFESAASGMTATANSFFTAVDADNFAEANMYLSRRYRERDRADLPKLLVALSLNHIAELKWSYREIVGTEGQLAGEVVTRSGKTIPLNLGFVKANDRWQLDRIEVREAPSSLRYTPPSG